MAKKIEFSHTAKAALLGGALGALVFLLIYGTGILDVTNDRWIFLGYDEPDIIQRYTGQMALLKTPWSFPLGQTSSMAVYGGSGVNIAFMDSIPLVAIFFKLFAPLLPEVFQFEGLYAFAVFILQGISAGMLLSLFLDRLSLVGLGTMFFVLSPVLLERAFRHTSLASHYFILFALYLYFRHRRDGRLPWIMVLLCGLTTGITPYFLPMVAIFALLIAIEHGMRTRKPLIPAVFFTASCAAALGLAWAIGSIGSGYAAGRTGYGYYSMNLNAPINPYSIGSQQYGYLWSKLIVPRIPTYGQYDGFNYLGAGVLLMLAAGTILSAYLCSRAQKRAWLRRNGLLLGCCVFLTAFAVSNVVCWNGTAIVIPLPEGLLQLCGIFRASSRMFYPVYYLLILFGIVALTRRNGDPPTYRLAGVLLAVMLAIQCYDISDALTAKHRQMADAVASTCTFPQQLSEAQNLTTMFLADDASRMWRTILLFSQWKGLQTNGYDTNTWHPSFAANNIAAQQITQQLDSGTLEGGLDANTLYVTTDPKRFAGWQTLYAEAADFFVWERPDEIPENIWQNFEFNYGSSYLCMLPKQ